LPSLFQAGGVLEFARRTQLGGRAFKRAVFAVLESGDACRLDVEPHGVEVLAEFDSQRQADITQPDNPDATTSQAQFHDFLFSFWTLAANGSARSCRSPPAESEG